MSPQQDRDSADDLAAKSAPYLPPPGGREFYRDPQYKSPITATVLSLLPGLGQVYLGYTQIGFTHAIAWAGFFALMSSERPGLGPFFGICMVFFFAYNLVDAYRRAILINESRTRLETTPLPDGYGAISFGTRLVGGVALILGGLMMFVHMQFGISFQWLEHWWPMGLVLLGIYLVIKAIQDRTPKSDSAQD